jgi:1-acyl-sn-glycerol-3-phosphate acyltransferase
MLQALRRLLLILLVRPFARIVIGIDVIGAENLPKAGPAIIAANHNSHLDTLILLCLFPPRLLEKVRPVAAADHFLTTPLSTFFSTKIVGVIPVKRKGAAPGEDVLAECKQALARGEILVIFPEGSRGEAEVMTPFKAGVARLAEAFPNAPAYPVYLQGAGRSLPKDAKLLVPFNCTAVVGETVSWKNDRGVFMAELRERIERAKELAPPLRWK